VRVLPARARALPERLVLFRDGVGEGYFETVLHEESAAIRGVGLEWQGYRLGRRRKKG
jgi:hypothetical protein